MFETGVMISLLTFLKVQIVLLLIFNVTLSSEVVETAGQIVLVCF